MSQWHFKINSCQGLKENFQSHMLDPLFYISGNEVQTPVLVLLPTLWCEAAIGHNTAAFLHGQSYYVGAVVQM